MEHLRPSVLRDIRAPYSRFESWVYDHLLSPAVAPFARPAQRRTLEALRRSGSVLDVGCGGGQLAIAMLRERPDLHCVGVDLSREQVERARRRARGLPGARFEAASALDLPFPEATFDRVVSVASLKHWPDPLRGLRECVRVLKPGGRALIVEADRGCRLDDARSFVGGFRVTLAPEAVRLAMFRTWVAGQGPDLDDARALASTLSDRAAWSVARIAGAPGLLIELERMA